MIYRAFSRRKFLQITGSTLLALYMGKFPSGEAAKPVPADPRWHALRSVDAPLDAQFVRQLITRDNRTSRTIMWQDSVLEPDAQVEYRPAGSDHSAVTSAAYTYFTDHDQSSYI